MNPYLARLRDQYESLRTNIEGLQTRAAEENRDLTEEELRSVQQQGATAQLIHGQITTLTEIETRNSQVAEMTARLNGDGSGEQTRSAGDTGYTRVGGATTQDRDPGHYRSIQKGGQYSFFGDMYRAKFNEDESAVRRLAEHTRALTTAAAGSGITPPRWLTEEYAELARQGRALANAVRYIPLGDDPRPLTLPKQSTGADAVNPAEQAAENDVTPSADKFDTDVDTVAPKPTRGKQIISRQMLDMSSPAVDLLIYGDLTAEYNRQVELKVCNAVITASGAALNPLANEAAFTATTGVDSVIDLAIAVRSARLLPADVLTMTITRWGKYKKLRDTAGRPLIPVSTAGPVNVAGVGSVNADGIIEDLPVIVTAGMGTGAAPDKWVALRASDTILFEGNEMRFRYEERSGPESVELGIWRYTAVLVRYAGASSKLSQVTA